MIKYAILGLLSWQPMAGYDLKKIFAASPILYWSGNNNQIYTALVQLHKEKLVTKEVQPQEDNPPRKVYTITERGWAALREWALTQPELPQRRHPFLVQLMWADQLTPDEIDNLLAAYEEALRVEELMAREQHARATAAMPARTSREGLLWEAIGQNVIDAHENELQWVRRLRADLAALKNE